VKTFDALYVELATKVSNKDAGSGTVALLGQGVHAVGKKVVEEAAEAWMAAEHESADRAADEIAQLLYQVQVLMFSRGITLDDVYRRL
jgi:phosphoribosyl-ATP pyrophosphohydrolase